MIIYRFMSTVKNAALKIQRITLPVKSQQRLEKAFKQQNDIKSTNSLTSRKQTNQTEIISCKRRKFNHFEGNVYDQLSLTSLNCLASAKWKNSKSVGDYFTINPYSKNPSFDIQAKFEDLLISPGLTKILYSMGFKYPTNVQIKAIPKMLKGQNVLCTAETGSGKTLSYLLPIIQRLKETTKYSNQQITKRISNQPRAVILVPNRELAEQVFIVSQHFCKEMGLITHYFVGGHKMKSFIKCPNYIEMDILIATPGGLSKLLTNKIYTTKNLEYVIIDECDTMLDDTFIDVTARVLKKLNVECFTSNGVELGTQIGLFSATVAKDAMQKIQGLIPIESLEAVQTPSVHKLMPHIAQKFVRVKSSEKSELLIKRVKANSEAKIPTIVFCNESSTSSYLSYILSDNKIPHEIINGKMPQHIRNGRYVNFINGKVDILVGTDIVSRGLDTCRAQHIINFNFPNFLSDYIHRVGRVGRIKSIGTGFIFNYICNKREVDLLWKIEIAARTGGILHHVDANIKHQLQSNSDELTGKYY